MWVHFFVVVRSRWKLKINNSFKSRILLFLVNITIYSNQAKSFSNTAMQMPTFRHILFISSSCILDIAYLLRMDSFGLRKNSLSHSVPELWILGNDVSLQPQEATLPETRPSPFDSIFEREKHISVQKDFPLSIFCYWLPNSQPQ